MSEEIKTAKHSDKLVTVNPQNTYRYSCITCGKNFNYIRNIKYHQLKAKHPAIRNTDEKKCRKKFHCGICANHSGSKLDLIDHTESFHDIKIEKESLKFTTMQEFLLWKTNIEKTTKSSFVKERSTYYGKDFSRTIFICHRSGFYKKEGKGERRLKLQGSNKINAYCPAGIKLLEKEGQCEIQYIKTHIGHENDLSRLFLSKSDRQTLATKLATKTPMNVILDEIKDSVSSNNLERLHLLTRKDLYNVQQSYNLSYVRHTSDEACVHAWVHEVIENGCVLLYKPQGEIMAAYTNLMEEDFMLIIMNQGQCEMLKKYSHDCICIDSSHGPNAHGYELHTLLVLNEKREGLPCCFCISNRSDEEVMKIFFMAIREKVGFSIKPKVFMSDLAESYYKAWTQIMEEPTFRIYCTWHVDRAWTKNLNKISSEGKQGIVYKHLRSLLQETNQETFTAMLNSFLTFILTDPSTIEFHEYFFNNFVTNVKCWSYCQRLQSGLNTNMHIERLHRTIKYLYLNGNYTKRLDKAIAAILKFVRDKLFTQDSIINEQEFRSKISNIRSRHKKSETSSFDSILPHEEGWQILSSTSRQFYYIQEENKHCECKLVCVDCNICLHRYSCSCLDSSINWNICTHIHLLVKHVKTLVLTTGDEDTTDANADSEQNQLDMDFEGEEEEEQEEEKEKQGSESDIATTAVDIKIRHRGAIISRKERISKELCEIGELLESTHSHADIDVIEYALGLIKEKLAALPQPVGRIETRNNK